ncbi:MAG: hypothetical protein WAN75_31360, partial [Xanthobacteraceae bacterium]
ASITAISAVKTTTVRTLSTMRGVGHGRTSRAGRMLYATCRACALTITTPSTAAGLASRRRRLDGPV